MNSCRPCHRRSRRPPPYVQLQNSPPDKLTKGSPTEDTCTRPSTVMDGSQRPYRAHHGEGPRPTSPHGRGTTATLPDARRQPARRHLWAATPAAAPSPGVASWLARGRGRGVEALSGSSRRGAQAHQPPRAGHHSQFELQILGRAALRLRGCHITCFAALYDALLPEPMRASHFGEAEGVDEFYRLSSHFKILTLVGTRVGPPY